MTPRAELVVERQASMSVSSMSAPGFKVSIDFLVSVIMGPVEDRIEVMSLSSDPCPIMCWTVSLVLGVVVGGMYGMVGVIVSVCNECVSIFLFFSSFCRWACVGSLHFR